MSNAKPLDLLLLSEEHAHDGRQTYQSFIAWSRERGTEFTCDVKQQLEQRFAVEDMLCAPSSERGPTDRYRLNLPHRPSLALCQLATVARAAGYTVCIVDNFLQLPFRRRQLRRIVRERTPRLIGLSTTFLLSAEMIESIVKELRQLAPRAKVVLGGPTARRLETLHGCGDFTAFGAGERPLLNILEHLDGEREVDHLDHVAYRDPHGNLQYGPGAEEAALVGKLGAPYCVRPDEKPPIPDWSLYHRSRRCVYSIEFCRGCRHNCFYCAYDRGKVVRELQDVRAELLANAALGITKYRVADSNFTDGPPSHRRYPHDICQLMLDLDLGLQWSCYARVDDMTDELALLMRRAGCFAVFFGVESGDDHILKLMRKGHDARAAARGIAIAKRCGLFVHANIVVGFPGETRESFDNTLAFIKRTRPDSVTLSHFYLTRRAPVYGSAMRSFDVVGRGMNWRHKTMDSSTADQLVNEGMQQLTSDGIILANEYEFSTMMSVGYSVDDARRSIAARSRRDSNRAAPLTQIPAWLSKMAEAIGDDQREMTRCDPESP